MEHRSAVTKDPRKSGSSPLLLGLVVNMPLTTKLVKNQQLLPRLVFETHFLVDARKKIVDRIVLGVSRRSKLQFVQGLLIVIEKTQRLSPLFPGLDEVRLSLHRDLQIVGRPFDLPLVEVDMAEDIVR